MPFESVFRLESRVGAKWTNIHLAHDKTVVLHRRLSEALKAEEREDASIVVVGSLGRFEVTDGDIDWTYLVDGPAAIEHQQSALRIAGIDLLQEKKPGREGVFGSIYCFSLAEGIWSDAGMAAGSERKLRAKEHLWGLTARTPLDLLADAFMTVDGLVPPAGRAFDAYDRFLGLLNARDERERLKALRPERADTDPLFEQVRQLGRDFQSGLDALFFHERSTRFPHLIEVYGVF